MPESTHHIIRQQYLDVELNGAESDGLTLQRKLTGICEHSLTPVIERVLNCFAPPDGHLYIERLEIDMGTIALEHLEQKLTNAVAEGLEKWFRENIPPGESSSIQITENARRKTAQHSINEAFIYFLKKGSLPWSFKLPAGKSLEKVIFDSWRQFTKSGDDWVLKDAVLQILVSVQVRMRLIRQFTPGFLELLLFMLSPAAKERMAEVLTALYHFSVPSIDLKHFEQHLWESVFAHLGMNNVLTTRSLIAEAWHAYAIEMPANSSLKTSLEQYWPGATLKNQAEAEKPEVSKTDFLEKEKKTISANLLKRKKKIVSNKGLSATENGLSIPAATDSSQKNTLDEQLPDNQIPASVRLSGIKSETLGNGESLPQNFLKAPILAGRRTNAEDMRMDVIAGIYIENAGLIILHPFLPQLFKALDISTETELLQPQRALCLLHFLTAGQTIAPEYELILPKILCNVPLEMPVESDVALTGDEQAEAVALLEAVIRHWEVLRNTSPDALRGTFLLRRGKVSLRDDGDWLLQMEAQSFDILLDQLPWSISMVKLPWMERMLWVEWH